MINTMIDWFLALSLRMQIAVGTLGVILAILIVASISTLPIFDAKDDEEPDFSDDDD